MKKYNSIIRSIIAVLLLAMVSLANGTASSNYNYQPKKPKCIDEKDDL